MLSILGRVDKVDSQISGGVTQDYILESSPGSRPDDGSRAGVLRAFCDRYRQQAKTTAKWVKRFREDGRGAELVFNHGIGLKHRPAAAALI